MGRPALPVEVQRLFWSGMREGEVLDDAARLAGVSKTVAIRWSRPGCACAAGSGALTGSPGQWASTSPRSLARTPGPA